MVEKRLLAVFIVTCELGLAVVLDLCPLHVHNVIPCLCSLPTITRRSSIWRPRLCKGDWNSKIWQKIHWFIVFHISILGDLQLFGEAKPTKPPLRQDWLPTDVYFESCITKPCQLGHRPSPVATRGFWGLSPPNKAPITPNLKHETL